MEIEVELRSIISKDKYDKLLLFFKKNGKFLGKENQITHYLDDQGNLRLQKSDSLSKIWLKEGKLHEVEHRETQIEFPREKFEELQMIFEVAGKPAKLKWFRLRHNFRWESANVMLDYTKGYGHILEIEIVCDKSKAAAARKKLMGLMKKLGLSPTPKKEFDEKYLAYKNNWKKLSA